jgi:hypothetical protein
VTGSSAASAARPVPAGTAAGSGQQRGGQVILSLQGAADDGRPASAKERAPPGAAGATRETVVAPRLRSPPWQGPQQRLPVPVVPPPENTISRKQTNSSTSESFSTEVRPGSSVKKHSDSTTLRGTRSQQQTLPRDDKRWASDLIPVRMAAVQDWSIEDVGRWICTEPIETASDVVELFAREEIDGRALLCYAAGARDLKQDLGLSVGKVTILMRGIHELADDESTHTVSSSSAQVPAQGPGKSARHILSAAEIRVNAHEQSGEVEKLFESYSHYWEIVALADGLCGTMAVVLVEATDEDDLSALTATFGATFGLAFIVSMAGLSLCVMNLVQFGFALDKAAFINRYSVRNQL